MKCVHKIPLFFVLSLWGALGMATTSGCQKNGAASSKSVSAARDEIVVQTVENNVAPAGETGTAKLAVGYQHVCAVASGKLRCWGLNRYGEIGNGDSGVIEGQRDPFTDAPHTVKTVLSPFESLTDVTDVAVGYEHTCAISAGTLYCFGSHEAGQLGLGKLPGDARFVSRPVRVLDQATQVAARGRLTCAVNRDGEAFCFGSRLVHDGTRLVDHQVALKPKRLPITARIESVHLSATHACALTREGALWCWGLNAAGEIGNGDTTGVDVPRPVEVFSGGVSQVALSDGRTCAVESGTMKCFGASLGDRAADATPQGRWKAPEYRPYTAVFWSSFAPGYRMSASGTVLSAEGDLFYGSYYHLGGTPRKIASGVIDFKYSEAELVGCMMFRNRRIKCWGSNTFGQLGIGERSLIEPVITRARDVKGFP